MSYRPDWLEDMSTGTGPFLNALAYLFPCEADGHRIEGAVLIKTTYWRDILGKVSRYLGGAFHALRVQ